MNIRSLTSILHLFIDQCLGENFKFDVMGFSETRLDNYIATLFNIPRYIITGIGIAEVLDFLNLMYSHGFSPLSTKATLVTGTGATLIDHIWTTHTWNNIKNCVVYTDITDHFLVFSQFLMKSN